MSSSVSTISFKRAFFLLNKNKNGSSDINSIDHQRSLTATIAAKYDHPEAKAKGYWLDKTLLDMGKKAAVANNEKHKSTRWKNCSLVCFWVIPW